MFLRVSSLPCASRVESNPCLCPSLPRPSTRCGVVNPHPSTCELEQKNNLQSPELTGQLTDAKPQAVFSRKRPGSEDFLATGPAFCQPLATWRLTTALGVCQLP